VSRMPTLPSQTLRRAGLAGLAAIVAGCATFGGGGGSEARSPDTREWIQAFNGRDLTGWTPKFKGYDLGVNFNDTFRVEEGLLKVRYDKWDTWNGAFGHLFYERPFSHYVVAAEYRFVGQQVKGAGPGLAWAIRNNGIMAASQSAESMGKDQDFPISLEVQLLGGLGDGRPRTTGNLCTPGTNVHFDETLDRRHCINSTSKTFDGEQWVRVEAMILGDSIIKHVVNGDTVMTYRKPEMGGGAVSGLKPGVMVDRKPITEGWFTIQAETAEIDFRKIEVLDLKGCTDPKATNYKRYFVKADPAACRFR
jgi:hypothetical protein